MVNLIFQQNSEGTIYFKLVPSDGKGVSRESKSRVRAHFDYNPDLDPYIPCKEAGLQFLRGDILHIVGQDDNYWWQARKEIERTARAGLIPSRALQERRIIHERTQTTDDKKENSKNLCAFFFQLFMSFEILHYTNLLLIGINCHFFFPTFMFL